jgi:hypothetical protein
LSRFEGDFSAAGDAQLSMIELLGLLPPVPAPARDLQQAIACYLSGGEGWDQARKMLGGAFASDAAEGVRSAGHARDKHEINQRASEYLQWPSLKQAGTDND